MSVESIESLIEAEVQKRIGARGEATEVDGLQYAIVRSYAQGVMCGFVESINGQTVTLRRARQMWRWSSRFVLPDIAEFGLTTRWERKFSAEMSQPAVMTEACGILYCTDVARDSLRAEPARDESND